MKFKNQFKRIGAAFLAATMLAPAIPVMAEGETTVPTFDLVVAVHYQNLTDDLDAKADDKTYAGIKAVESKPVYDTTGITKMYVVEVPVNTEGYDLLNQNGVTCYEFNKNTNQKGEKIKEPIKFNEFEGVTITPEDAHLARTITKDKTQGDGQFAGDLNAIHLKYDRNVYSIFVDANGGELINKEGKEKPSQYNFFYGENFKGPNGDNSQKYNEERSTVDTVMSAIWNSEPQKGVRNDEGKIENPDKFVDWRAECRTKEKMYMSKCAEENNGEKVSYTTIYGGLGGMIGEGEAYRMPAADIVFRAHWRTTETPVTVIYNLQNANDNEYSAIGSDTIYMPSGMKVINTENKYHVHGEEKTEKTNAQVEYELSLSAEAIKQPNDTGYTVYVTGHLGEISNFVTEFHNLKPNSESQPKTVVTGTSDVVGKEDGKNSNIKLTMKASVDANGKPSVEVTKAELEDGEGAGNHFTSRYETEVKVVSPETRVERVELAQKTYTLKFKPKDNLNPIMTDLYEIQDHDSTASGAEKIITNESVFDDKDYFSFYYCDAYQKLDNGGNVETKAPDEITTVDYHGHTFVNVYYTRNYYALQFHLAKEIDGSNVSELKSDYANAGYDAKPYTYANMATMWGVDGGKGKQWAISTLTRSRNGYITKDGEYDWKKEGSTDPTNSSGFYNAFGTVLGNDINHDGNNNGLFSWGNNLHGDKSDKVTPNYVYLNTKESKKNGEGNAAMPYIDAGGVTAKMSNREDNSAPTKQEYTIIARYGANIENYWPIGDNVKNAEKKYTWNKYNADNVGGTNFILQGEDFARYSLYTWHTNYDTLYHGSRTNNMNIIGKYSTLDKQLIVQDLENRVGATPEPMPTALPNPNPYRSATLHGGENDLIEDIFTPESMDQEVNLGSEGEIEDFVVDENEMPDGTYFDPTEIEDNSEDSGTYGNYNEDLSLMAAEDSNPTTKAISTTAKEVRFDGDKVRAQEPIYLAAPEESVASDEFVAKTPEQSKALHEDTVKVTDVGYKHDLTAFWNPENRNWRHVYHFYFEDPNDKSGNSGTITVKKDEKLEHVNKKINGKQYDTNWRPFSATFTSTSGAVVDLRATADFRDKYGLEGNTSYPVMPQGFEEDTTFYETESSEMNTVGSNMAQNAPEKKGYRLYYIGHTKNDDYTTLYSASTIKTSDIYLFYVPERYTVTYVTYPGQTQANRVTKTVKYDQKISSDMNLKPFIKGENGEEKEYTQLTDFKNECTFGGWYYDPNYKDKVDFTDPNYKYQGDVIYYAKWIPPTHTVTFKMNGFVMDTTLTNYLKAKFGEENITVDNDQVVIKNVPNGTNAEDILFQDYENYIKSKGFNIEIEGEQQQAANVSLRFSHWVDTSTGNRYGFGAGQYITKDLTVRAVTLDDRGYTCYILRNKQDIALYTSVNAALKEFTDADYKIVMLMNTKENIDIDANLGENARRDKDVLLDFHGWTITGNVEIAEGYKFCGIDTFTDGFGTDYTAEDKMGGAYGGLIGQFVTDLTNPTSTITKPADNIDDLSKITATKSDTDMLKSYTFDYVSYKEPNGWSFHRVYSDVWADVVQIENGNTANITFVTGYYGDSKAKKLLTEGNENDNNYKGELGADLTGEGLKESGGVIDNVSDAFMKANFYKATVTYANRENKFVVTPTITNNNGVIKGTDNAWLKNQTGYSVADAIKMIFYRYDKENRIGYNENQSYLDGDRPSQYSDYSDSDSNTDKRNTDLIYTKTDRDRMGLWLGLGGQTGGSTTN